MMKKNSKAIFLLVLMFISYTVSVQASHCYSYTVRASYDMVLDGDSIYLQETIKDGNGISYVSQRRVKLDAITDKNFTIISQTGSLILLISDGYYYMVPKDIFQIENYGIRKLFRAQTVDRVVSDCFFLIAGQWHYVQPKAYSNQLINKTLPMLRGNLEIMANYDRGELLLKDDNRVYVFDQSKYALTPIPKLTAAKAKYVETNDFYGDNHFLYDDDTFYLTSIRFIYKDVTSSFNQQGKYKGFSDAEVVVTNKVSIDTHDGLLWLYLSGGKTLDSGQTVYFYPLQAQYLNRYRSIYLYDGKIYVSNWEAINEMFPLDPSTISDLKTLNCTDFGYNYSDSLAFYVYNSDQHKLNRVDAPALSRVDSLKLDAANNYKSFGLGYTYRDKICIENRDMQNPAESDDLKFLGSTVTVVQACDGFDRKNNTYYSVMVLYNYFFRDDNHVYYYQSGQNELQLLDDALANNYQSDSYPDLIQLTSLAKLDKEGI